MQGDVPVRQSDEGEEVAVLFGGEFTIANFFPFCILRFQSGGVTLGKGMLSHSGVAVSCCGPWLVQLRACPLVFLRQRQQGQGQLRFLEREKPLTI